VITAQLGLLTEEIGRALKGMGFVGTRGQQVVFSGGGAELAGLADYAQAALGKPVRIGRPPQLKGLAEAHAVPGFSTLAGLILYAMADPVDIRSVTLAHQTTHRYSGFRLVSRVYRAMKEYF
jgi:cell division protein FtsA